MPVKKKYSKTKTLRAICNFYMHQKHKHCLYRFYVYTTPMIFFSVIVNTPKMRFRCPLDFFAKRRHLNCKFLTRVGQMSSRPELAVENFDVGQSATTRLQSNREISIVIVIFMARFGPRGPPGRNAAGAVAISSAVLCKGIWMWEEARSWGIMT